MNHYVSTSRSCHIDQDVQQANTRQPSPLYENKTQVVPLPVLPYNEQCYQDTVKILDFYEDTIHNIGGTESQKKFQIGGDQLTREHFF